LEWLCRYQLRIFARVEYAKILDQSHYVAYFERPVATYADRSTSPASYPRLRPGPGLDREIVGAHQRSRIQRAMIEIVATDGYEAVTVRGLAKRARVSSGTFYRRYTSTDDCLLCTYDAICGRASRRMGEAGQRESEPRRRLAAAVTCLFEDMVEAPQVATFMLRAAHTVGPAFVCALSDSSMRLGAALEFCLKSDNGVNCPLLLEGMVAGLARIGSGLGPAATPEEIERAATEAVKWAMGLLGPIPNSGLPVCSDPDQRDGAPAHGRLRKDDLERILGDERAMVLAAAFRIARRGYHQLSVPRICREAGVSRRNFNRYFETLEECFVTAVEEHAVRAVTASLRRNASGSRSPALYAVLKALCEGIEEDRDSARVLFVDITAAGTLGMDSRDHLISEAARLLRTTRPDSDEDHSESAAEASAAAAWAILRRQVLDQVQPVAGSPPLLMLFLLGPRRDEKRTVEIRNIDRRWETTTFTA
jgi:AcrR family transcriptional regulator